MSDSKDLTLLRELFRATRAEYHGASRRGFLARNPNDVEEVERLIAAGDIQYRDGKYLRLPLLGLIELATVMPEAESVRYLCSHLFQVLRAAFIDDPDSTLSVMEIAKLADMPEKRVAAALEFLLDAPVFESWSTVTGRSYDSIVLSDRILRYQTFDEVVEAMRAQRRASPLHAAKKFNSDTGAARQGVASTHPYVDLTRLHDLKTLSNKKWDLTRLVRMCEELNDAFERDAFITCSMLVRGIVDHVPPIFNCKSFGEVANNYPGSSVRTLSE
jgi:hypothetical protein